MSLTNSPEMVTNLQTAMKMYGRSVIYGPGAIAVFGNKKLSQ
jgi:hypothetical protein